MIDGKNFSGVTLFPALDVNTGNRPAQIFDIWEFQTGHDLCGGEQPSREVREVWLDRRSKSEDDFSGCTMEAGFTEICIDLEEGIGYSQILAPSEAAIAFHISGKRNRDAASVAYILKTQNLSRMVIKHRLLC